MKPFFLLVYILLLLGPAALGVPAQISPNPQVNQAFQEGVEALVKHRPDLALQQFLPALKQEPENPHLHWETGWAYWQQQNWAKVLEHWQITRRVNPKQEEFDKYYNLASQYHDWEAQAEQRQKVVSLPPRSQGQKGQITLVAVGDIMMGSSSNGPQGLPPQGGENLFTAVKPALAGDLVFGNLEGPLTNQPQSAKCKPDKKCFAFKTPPAYARHLAQAGFNILSLANNHSSDYGIDGLKDTMAALEQEQLLHFGNWARPFVILELQGMKVAFLGAATTYCCLHVNQLDKLVPLVKDLKRKADLVVVSFHAGAEGLGASRVPRGDEMYLGENRGDVRRFAHAMVDAGADLVLGHGPHSLRGMELYQGKAIAYSLGNFMGYMGMSTSGHLSWSVILKAQLDKKGKLLRLDLVPLRLSPQVIPAFDEKGRALDLINRLSREDFGPSALLVNEQGGWSP